MSVGFQDLWIAGTRLYLKRDPIGTVDQPIIDLGILEPTGPAVAPQLATAYDSDGGIQRIADQAVTRIDETYACKTLNMNLDNLALLFMANPATAFTQAATPVTGTHVHPAHLGRLLKVVDNSGNSVWGLTSIEAVKDGATTFVLGTDYEIYNLERGMIRILAGGSITENENLTINYTPRAIASQKSLLNPQNFGGIVKATAYLVYGRNNNTVQSVREAHVSVVPGAAKVDVVNYSDLEIKLTVLSDSTKAIPAGSFLQWLGTLPSVS